MTTPAKKTAKKTTAKPGPPPQAKQQQAKKDEPQVVIPADNVVVPEVKYTHNHQGFAVHPDWDEIVAEQGDPLADRLTEYRWAEGNPLTGTPSRPIGHLLPR